jgi:hypothetical protein
MYYEEWAKLWHRPTITAARRSQAKKRRMRERRKM